MKRILPVLVLLITIALSAQELKSPSEFLGYELGTQFTRHHQVVDYYQYLSVAAKDRMQINEYGKTNEQRPLLLAYLSSSANMENLEAIRKEHLNSTSGEGKSTKAIVWLSYNVHGNESAGTEASMQTIYELLTSKQSYLENTVVIIDPCINPDGRDRYVNWYNQFKNTPYQLNPESKEHYEGWWSGRSNHYMFDLNRDWAWLTQLESRQRLRYYNKWLPHIHVDFHEQGIDSPYYFAPAAEPFHEVITDFQRDFQVTIGKNHAKYFDANGWFYFTKERFDLFYPSYGDTYPTYNGAIGMTYEQGGGGRAGLGVITGNGDTLTLKDRIVHHHTTGISTVEVATNNVAKLNEEYQKFFQPKNYKYKSYILKGQEDHLRTLTELLDRHQLNYSYGTGAIVKGFDYKSGKTGSLKTNSESIIISTNQARGTLVKVLFEPNAKLSDSLSYDITAWSLPYAYGLDAIASENLINGTSKTENSFKKEALSKNTYAFLTEWNGMDDARFLSELLERNIRVRQAQKPFTLEGKRHDRGSLIITKADNENNLEFTKILSEVAEKHHKTLTAVSSGFVDEGKDFGSSYVQMIPAVKVAVLAGEPTSTLRFGEIWHFFEQQLHYPLTILDANYLNELALSNYEVLILPGGTGYKRFMDKTMLSQLKEWVSRGGRLIAMGKAIASLDGEDGFRISAREKENDSTVNLVEPYENLRREEMKNEISGAIFKTRVDTTHPLAFGYTDTYFSLKLGNGSYDYLESGTVAYISTNTVPVAGFAGCVAQKKMSKSLVFGVEKHGKGQVVYMVDNPLFRGFWENGKLFFVNALFMAK
ncbi:M14 metallopeptidase family protein [uncultured Eudoraea sp.]|uniref:M14 metallopeptidase family protein n=1 Tax=uncultured Eudoraea sp. TaxID=1035614 RepID=UPI00260B5625|nr:M14 metallopeptidase family protein [uncultured Eudoraea sp.]